jgi:hypothetical protein
MGMIQQLLDCGKSLEKDTHLHSPAYGRVGLSGPERVFCTAVPHCVKTLPGRYRVRPSHKMGG